MTTPNTNANDSTANPKETMSSSSSSSLKNDDLTSFLDTIDTLPTKPSPPPPTSTSTSSSSIHSMTSSLPRSTNNSPLPSSPAIQTLDSYILPSSLPSGSPQVTSFSSSSSSINPSKSNTPIHAKATPPTSETTTSTTSKGWGGLGSWFQAVVQETQHATSMVTQNMKHLGEMTSQLVQETQTATQKLTQTSTWKSVMDSIVPETVQFNLQLQCVGLCNVPHFEQDISSLLKSLFLKKDFQLNIHSIENVNFRSFIYEETESDWSKIYEQAVMATPPDVFSASSSSSPSTPILGIHVLPIFLQHQYLIYLCTVHGLGQLQRTFSQSILKGNQSLNDIEWERLVLRSALRDSLEEWFDHLHGTQAWQTWLAASSSSLSSSSSVATVPSVSAQISSNTTPINEGSEKKQ